MKFRVLGSTGLKTSVVGVGTWQFGGEWGKDFTAEEVKAILNRARELGINLLDTAECYGDHLSEKLIGGAIEGKRDQWIVATKFGHAFEGHLKRSEPRKPADVTRQLEDSLRALRTDYIDLYQYHSWGDADFDDRGVLDVLLAAKRAGKVRHLGNSIASSVKQTHQAALSRAYQVEALQVVYNRLDAGRGDLFFPPAREMNLGFLARVPLASGFLSGKYKPGDPFPANDFRKSQPQEEIDRKLREAERIAREEVPPAVPMAQWALAWCLRDPAVTAVIPGCKSVGQVESNARAAELVNG